VYRPTAKNGLVKELYDQMGFRRVSEEQGQVHYELEVPTHLTVSATRIRHVTADGQGAAR
jgi:predicted enzyme involved in methoxymalonyl-ACP biosynthesis